MAQGSGSSNQAKFMVPLLLWFLVFSETVDATTYTVGGSDGWTFNTATWPRGKHFKAGDKLLFKYDPTLHNVVAVNRGGYRRCITPAAGAKVYKSGKDEVKLHKGLNFFICNIAGHCESGMKIAINAV
ncbi:Basic blue protein [Hibiscus syriacus]|uniref:Basic blue protein n=1 Tax=Hibiscus syriacus TaxID=106335 RepID=A0A6A3BE47_HIBSY|nr:basic blue protein-like [Hibiscus syriacus]KAE8714317.1 Basic blue protein [Hibiscus syriacus]